MTPFFLINTTFVVLISFISALLGLWVYLADRKSRTNKIFLIMTVFVILWLVSAYSCNFLTTDGIALFWARTGYGAGALFLLFSYLFSNFFPVEEKKRFYITSRIAIIICLLLFFLSIFTNLVVKDVVATQWGTLPSLGKGEALFMVLILFLGLLFAIQFISKYFSYTKENRLKVQYIFIGLFIFLTMNLIFNIILPLWQKIPYLYHFGNYSAIFFLGFTAFAIVKQKLFGIKVVLTEILVGVIAILLLAQIFGSKSPLEYSWKIALFILFLVSGYLLVKSVMGEIKNREELQAAYQELQRLDMAKSEFISIASHQLRTPLTAVKGYISMILDNSYGKISAKVREVAERIYSSNERLIRLVNDLLNVSRVEMGKMELEPKMASLEETISNVVEELQFEAKRKNIYLKFEKPEKPLPKVLIDADKIRQVLINVIDNAIKYTPEGGITVKVKRLDMKIRIEIYDTGEGMNRLELAKLFGTFSRGEAGAKLYTEGAGIGLHIAKLFVEMHQGQIWAESEGRGKGSVFYIELPFKDWQMVEFLGNI